MPRLAGCNRDAAGGARHELRALALIGRGDFGAKEWPQAIAQAAGARDTPVEFLAGDLDLHEELEKALFELKLA